MTTEPIDTMELARRELATEMLPSPDDMFDELSPVAALFFTEQCTVQLFKQYVADLGENDLGIDDTATGAGKALACIGQALGMLDQACVAMGILPDEAIQP